MKRREVGGHVAYFRAIIALERKEKMLFKWNDSTFSAIAARADGLGKTYVNFLSGPKEVKMKGLIHEVLMRRATAYSNFGRPLIFTP